MPRILPQWVKEASQKHEDQINRNLTNAAKATKQKQENRKQRQQQHNNNHNTNNNRNRKRPKPSTPPPMDPPDISVPSPKHTDNRQKATTKPKPKTNRKKPKQSPPKKKKKTPKKKRKNKNNLMLDTDEDEWSDSAGSIGSLADFVIEDINSDEEYDPRNDLRDRKRHRNYNSDGDLISDDEGDFSESFGSLMNLNGASYNSMIISPPLKKKRKGIRTVCDIKPLCRWGEKCYRKNSKHLEEYSHPWKNKKQ